MSQVIDEAAGEVFLSLVIPVFNEEESLPHLWAKIHEVLAVEDWAWEVVFIDDGSTDGSFAALAVLAEQFEEVRALRFRRNHRKAAALAAEVVRPARRAIQALVPKMPAIRPGSERSTSNSSQWRP